jgi:hypothetical protein
MQHMSTHSAENRIFPYYLQHQHALREHVCVRASFSAFVNEQTKYNENVRERQRSRWYDKHA